MDRITLPAKTEHLDQVLEFIDAILDRNNCPESIKIQLDIAVEELFVNIASYAYEPHEGPADITCKVDKATNIATLEFRDKGIPYNPLAREDPDLTLSAEERGIGGLGIFMVKNSMDKVSYDYEDGTNILTIEKRLTE